MYVSSHIPPCLMSIVIIGIVPVWATIFHSNRRKKKLPCETHPGGTKTNTIPSGARHGAYFLLLTLPALLVIILALISCTVLSWHLTSLTPFPAEFVGESGRGSYQKHHHEQQQPVFHEGHVLITGASQGIGRAITLELAKRYAPSKRFIITSRSLHSLNQLAEQIQSLYHANVTVISNVDLSKPGGAQLLYQTTKDLGLYVDVLILNAGVGSRGSLVSMDIETIQNMLHLNVESTTILASLYGQDMKHHLRDKIHNSQSDANKKKEISRELIGARIMIMSSIVGIVPGVPYASLYAASKAYLRSLSWGLAAELQPLGIGVTCVLPGATASTNFASSSSINDALVWHYPWVVSTPDAVACRAVDGMERGHIEVFPGRALDLIFSKVVMPLLPPWFVTWFFGISWSSGAWLYRSSFFRFMKQLLENGDMAANKQQSAEL